MGQNLLLLFRRRRVKTSFHSFLPNPSPLLQGNLSLSLFFFKKNCLVLGGLYR
ncbi:unnamed protein product [Brassica rapa subsp. narinosa]